MQVLCGLQGIFLLFNCQTPVSWWKTAAPAEAQRRQLRTKYLKHFLIHKYKLWKRVIIG